MLQSEIAQRIAIEVHTGQVDKAGKPYIEHPAHVAASVDGDEAKAVAWLHDAIEDYLDYVHAIKQNELARIVKLADLRHNSDLSRLTEIRDEDLVRTEKYHQAIAILEE
mgnify:CR=1 FL=1